MQKKIYKARYSEIAQTLINQITSGHYELGQQLPSEQAMSESFNVSRFTIRAALREIEKMGMIKKDLFHHTATGRLMQSLMEGHQLECGGGTNFLSHDVKR